eukprot:COSAG06_NODE_929_length_11465_cov_4.106722_12_plen_68_part_00
MVIWYMSVRRLVEKASSGASLAPGTRGSGSGSACQPAGARWSMWERGVFPSIFLGARERSWVERAKY